MGSSNNYVKAQLITSGDAAQNHDTSDASDPSVYGAPLDVGKVLSVAFQLVWKDLEGVLDGEIQVWLSLDGGTNWVQKNGAGFAVVGASGTDSLSLNQIVSEELYKVIYSKNGVTGGTVDLYAYGK